MSLQSHLIQSATPPPPEGIVVLSIGAGGIIPVRQKSVEALVHFLETQYKNPVQRFEVTKGEQLLIVRSQLYDVNFRIAGKEYFGFGYVVGFDGKDYADTKVGPHHVDVFYPPKS